MHYATLPPGFHIHQQQQQQQLVLYFQNGCGGNLKDVFWLFLMNA